MPAENADSTETRPGDDVPYEDWTVAQLRRKATELHIEGRSYMKKQRLVDALRRH
jgi:hypothetical protein